jgi:hypothetical protein
MENLDSLGIGNRMNENDFDEVWILLLGAWVNYLSFCGFNISPCALRMMLCISKQSDFLNP